MLNALKNKRYIVVGANGLLGRRIVAGLLEQGCNIVAADLKFNFLEAFIKEHSLDMTNVRLFEADLLDEINVARLFSEQTDLDGLVNSAYPRNKNYGADFLDVSLKDFNDNISLQLGLSFRLMQEAVRFFKKHKSSFSYVNVASVYGAIPPRFSLYEDMDMTMPVEYAAIKSALIHLNRYVTSYVSDSKFRVNSVSPGGIEDNHPRLFKQRYTQHTLGTGMLKAEDVVGTILFLLSDLSQHVVGQNIIVDDGFSL